ncbi:hypothetical protein A3709_19525 [Halioglobus sp. HI00S01]|uniref:hypothetical protein n=1 Tax=Halioglobus sp. HI00S01 TaxID=1822214 RepID=UPI0007C376CE|nr:hypothetical protein [Halioglobus sp. HI00S01]KZX57816.1 hypothetical protein A3709_19525 [Halioglobus sp. HI00S01]
MTHAQNISPAQSPEFIARAFTIAKRQMADGGTAPILEALNPHRQTYAAMSHIPVMVTVTPKVTLILRVGVHDSCVYGGYLKTVGEDFNTRTYELKHEQAMDAAAVYQDIIIQTREAFIRDKES